MKELSDLFRLADKHGIKRPVYHSPIPEFVTDCLNVMIAEIDARMTEYGARIGRQDTKNCLHCDTPFVIGSGTGKTDKRKYCSGRCRVAHGRLLRKRGLTAGSEAD